jgi:hypothetical protein
VTWAGPAVEDLATPLAWLFATLLVVGAAVGPVGDGRGGHESGGTVTVTTTDGAETVTTTRWFTTTGTGTAAPDATASGTTTTGTIAATTTGTTTSATQATTTQTGTPPPTTQLAWPIPSAKVMQGAAFRALGVWSGAGPPATIAGVTWQSGGPVGYWDGTLSGSQATLEGMTVTPLSSSPGVAFGTGFFCAKARLFVFDDDGELVFATAPVTNYDRFEQDPSWATVEYSSYYLGNQNPSPNQQCTRIEDADSTGLVGLFKPTLRTLLTGLHTSELRTQPIACTGFIGFACGTWETDGLYATVVLDEIHPAA